MAQNLKLITYPEDLVYSSDAKHKPLEFYISAISQAQRIDLKLGYFSSNAIRVLSVGFASFIQRGGKLRVITNHFYSENDKKLFFDDTEMEKDAQENIKSIIKEDDYESLEKLLVEGEQHFFDCLKYLKNNKLLEIQPVKLKEGGMSHYKEGIFDDGENQVSFSGSCNFTYKGLIENGETINLNRSWGSDVEKVRITNLQKSINDIFGKRDEQYTYLTSEDILDLIDEKADSKNITELLRQEHKILNKALSNYSVSPSAKNALNGLNWKLSRILGEPSFPFEQGPRDYQTEAYENWVKNDRKGIFAMATGTGKTITALNCLLNEYRDTEFYQALILVPTKDLLKQWIKEIGKFNFYTNIIFVTHDPKWKSKISKLTTSLAFGAKKSFVIISTYDSFLQNTFQSFLGYIPETSLLIADEAHNIARPKLLHLLGKIKISKRIGLSATPKRIYDDEGTQAMNRFFSDDKPYTYEYSMEEAISNGILSQYEYYPHIVPLTNEEFNKYKKLTRQLIAHYDSKQKSFKKSEELTQLLMRRKRIIHKAENKISVFRSIIKDELKKNGSLNYAFVYVPEGIDNNSAEENKIIAQYNQAVMDISPNTKIAAFTGETHDRENILSQFEKGNIDVLTAMKCLDEGVDIPRTELAIFCASTANPRQFIQRRGRILREHIDKDYAKIHDLVVVPKSELSDEKSETYKMEQSQVTNEIKRVADFAFMSLNQFQALEMIEDICNYYEIDINSIKENID